MDISSSQTPAPESSPGPASPSPSNKRLWAWVLFGLLILAGGGFALWRLIAPGSAPAQEQMAGPPGMPVKTQLVETSTVEDSTKFIGSLEAQQGIALRPKTEGRITQVFASAGDIVAVGDPIVQLSPDRRQAEVNAAISNANAARASRNNSQAQLQAAQSRRIEAAADVELQETEYERISGLVAEGVLPEQRLDQVRRDRNAARAALAAAEDQIRAARASLDEANAGLAQAQAESAAVVEDLQDTRVSAPIDGVVGELETKLGDYVTAGDVITNITQNQSLELNLPIPLERQNDLRSGLPVELRLFQGDQPLVTGRISFISPQADAGTQTVLAKATFPNPGGRLQDGQRVEARVIWQRNPGVLVPTAAVSRLGGQTFLYVVEQGENPQTKEPAMVARQTAVKLGEIQGNSYQVLEGVEAGDRIVVSGILNLSDGAPIMEMDPSQQAGGPPGGPAQ